MHSDGSTESRPTKEFLPAPARFLSGSLFAAHLLRRTRPAKHAVGQIAHGRFPKLPRGAPRTFLATVTVIAEQARDRITAAKKVNLKAVSLFFGA